MLASCCLSQQPAQQQAVGESCCVDAKLCTHYNVGDISHATSIFFEGMAWE